MKALKGFSAEASSRSLLRLTGMEVKTGVSKCDVFRCDTRRCANQHQTVINIRGRLSDIVRGDRGTCGHVLSVVKIILTN